MIFQQGSLWDTIVATTGKALASGSLLSFPTRHAFIEDQGMRFFVRILSTLERKDEARKKQASETASGKNVNPFLPPEKELLVAELSDTHIAILNKFNVVSHHLLIVTRHFEEQETLLTLQDFEALSLCMLEFEGLAFYNGGREAGASQKHKHLQMVPLPLAPEGPAVPIEPLLARTPEHGISMIPGLPFLHAFVRLDRGLAGSPHDAAKTMFGLYCSLLSRVGMTTPSLTGLTRQSLPYCFLATRDWMLLVPRSQEYVEDISLNSLAFVGSFFVRNSEQLERLKAFRPMHALETVALSP